MHICTCNAYVNYMPETKIKKQTEVKQYKRMMSMSICRNILFEMLSQMLRISQQIAAEHEKYRIQQNTSIEG